VIRDEKTYKNQLKNMVFMVDSIKISNDVNDSMRENKDKHEP